MGLSELAELLRREGGLVAATVVDPPERPAPVPERYALLFESIREGYLLHFGEPRVARTQDADLALLAGDRLYALGLDQLAAMGDIEAVRLLADAISDCARAHAEGRGTAEADAVWARTAAALGG